MKSLIRHISIVFILLLSLAYVSEAQQASITASLDSQEIIIGNPVHLQLKIKKPTHETSIFPVVTDSITPAIGIISQPEKWDTVAKTKQSITLQKTITLSAYDSGRIVIPALPLIIQTNDTTADTLYSDSLALQVHLLPVDTAHPHIADIKPPLNTPFNFAEFKALYLPKILIGLAILLLLFAGYYYWKRYRKNHEDTPIAKKHIVEPSEAHHIALKKLESLKEKKLWQHDKIKEYYSELIDIFREYLENRYRVSAMEKTSDEIVELMASVVEQHDAVELMKALLPVSDLAKFAKYKPLPDENENSLKTVLQFIEQTQWRKQNEPEASESEDDNTSTETKENSSNTQSE